MSVDVAVVGGAELVTFVHAMLHELRLAREKHPGEEGALTDAEWLAVLTEEVGETARAIQDEDDAALRRELAQVAAMACRWAVSIPHGRVRPPWAQREIALHAGHVPNADGSCSNVCYRIGG